MRGSPPRVSKMVMISPRIAALPRAGREKSEVVRQVNVDEQTFDIINTSRRSALPAACDVAECSLGLG